MLHALHDALRHVSDVERCLSRVLYKTATPREVVALLTTVAEFGQRLGVRITAGDGHSADPGGGWRLIDNLKTQFGYKVGEGDE